MEVLWIRNFKKSELVKNGKFNSSFAKELFNGPDQPSNFPFKRGFSDFYIKYKPDKAEEHIKELIKYLRFIGIRVEKQNIESAIRRKEVTYEQLLDKAFYIFKHLSLYDHTHDIENPFKDFLGDLEPFIVIEQGYPLETAQLKLFDQDDLSEFYSQHFQIPEQVEKDPTFQFLFDTVENKNKSLFITGKAGTGKSTFIHYFTKNTKKNVILLASTGIAAINIGGQTIHSFFSFPLKPLLPEDEEIVKFGKNHSKRKIIQKTNVIIIDEVSMLRADILEGIDYSLRINGGNPHLPFGGIQIILVGDIFQLPPIYNTRNQVEKELFKNYYNSQFFFDSPAFNSLSPIMIELNKIHRQSDPVFIQLLNKVRDCTATQREIDSLNTRYQDANAGLEEEDQDFFITLSTTNKIAQTKNHKELNTLQYKSHFFKAKIEGEFPNELFPTDLHLELKRNAQVMVLRNDVEKHNRRWVNGTIAKIEFINNETIEIRLNDGKTYKVEKEIWENRVFKWDKKKSKIVSKIIGTFEQFPLKLAWAITIHKSQGLTFNNTIIDLGYSTFTSGQLYTALSRCRTIEGMIFKRPIFMSDMIINNHIMNFYNNRLIPQKMGI